MSTKGSWQRPSQISDAEKEIRWELAFCKDEKRKDELRDKLKAIQTQSDSD